MSFLICPRCDKLLVEPTAVCEAGHTFCKTCISDICSICSLNVIKDTRNLAIEDICKKIGYPCPNRIYGCNHIITRNLHVGHISRCMHNEMVCPVGMIPGMHCGWTGLKRFIYHHTCYDHGEIVTRSSQIISMNNNNDAQFMIYDDEIFMFGKFRLYDIWCAFVQRAGLTSKSYKYIFKLVSHQNGFDTLEMTFPVFRFDDDFDKRLELGDALILRDNECHDFAGENGLFILASIEEIS
ncbi:hypothetical protein L9F63_024425 [Diploptera punctata]|uniref:SIAH-type domain-containing protein n=1 Tax=Diploptera punctata TaxID=6984 RepID=A0AAD7ZEW6_DIPPU|nr:hypothetical protein L9F63_024425 [Diploptera punctata]